MVKDCNCPALIVNLNIAQATPNYWVRLNTVQESDFSGVSHLGGLTGVGTTTPAVVNASFARFLAMAGDINRLGAEYTNGPFILNANNCEFYNTIVCYPSTTTALNVTNCLFERSYIEKECGCWGDINLPGTAPSAIRACF